MRIYGAEIIKPVLDEFVGDEVVYKSVDYHKMVRLEKVDDECQPYKIVDPTDNGVIRRMNEYCVESLETVQGHLRIIMGSDVHENPRIEIDVRRVGDWLLAEDGGKLLSVAAATELGWVSSHVIVIELGGERERKGRFVKNDKGRMIVGDYCLPMTGKWAEVCRGYKVKVWWR